VELVNSGCHMLKCSQNCPQFGHQPSKTFASPVLGRKTLKHIGLQERKVISQPRAPISIRPAIVRTLKQGSFKHPLINLTSFTGIQHSINKFYQICPLIHSNPRFKYMHSRGVLSDSIPIYVTVSAL